MTRQSSYHNPDDEFIDHEAIAQYEELGLEIASFLRAHDDVRISLARHRNRGNWFLLVTSTTGLGQIQSDLAANTTKEQMGEHVALLYGRLGHANKAAAKTIAKKIEQHKAEIDWENW